MATQKAKQLKITLVKSGISFPKDQKATIKALGLGKLNSSVIQNDCPEIRGMVFKIKHLLKVEEA